MNPSDQPSVEPPKTKVLYLRHGSAALNPQPGTLLLDEFGKLLLRERRPDGRLDPVFTIAPHQIIYKRYQSKLAVAFDTGVKKQVYDIIFRFHEDSTNFNPPILEEQQFWDDYLQSHGAIRKQFIDKTEPFIVIALLLMLTVFLTVMIYGLINT